MNFSVGYALLGAAFGAGLACLLMNVVDYWRGVHEDDE